MSLGEITEHHHNTCCKDLGYCWIKIELLHKQLQKNVVKKYAYAHHHQVSNQLYPAPDG
jgi:hypothetical protein